MSQTSEIFIRTLSGIQGPLSLSKFQKMFKAGRINSKSQVSMDGNVWFSADKMKELMPTGKVKKKEKMSHIDITRPELRKILKNIQRISTRLSLIFAVAISAITVFTGCGVLAAIFHFARGLHSSTAVLIISAIIPSLLIAMAVGHIFGNLLLSVLTSVTSVERRCLALHLPWSRTPEYWPEFLKSWIYHGDWLVKKVDSELLPYARAFVVGEPPETIEDELDIWVELMHRTKRHCSEEMEVGHSIRELACVDHLPAWTREIEPGMTLNDLQQTLGSVGREWAQSILKRAQNRMPALKKMNINESMDQVSFEFHYCEMSDSREGLIIILRPRPSIQSRPREKSANAA